MTLPKASGQGSYGIGSSQIIVNNGPINLTGSLLNAIEPSNGLSVVPENGEVITLIRNNTGAPVLGTFDGLSEGDTFEFNHNFYKISYVGGDSGQDVTLTVANPAIVTPPPVVLPPVSSPVTTPVTTPATTPTVAQPMPATSTSSVRPTISVQGADTSTLGESGLTYTWSVAQAPRGSKAVSFAGNGTNAAKTTTAWFKKAGTYVLMCTITNDAGNSVTTNVTMTIKQVESGLRLTPYAVTLTRGSTTQFGGIVLDQFKHAMRTASSLIYNVIKGGGSINSAGAFVAGPDKGHVVVQITVDGLTGTVGATIV